MVQAFGASSVQAKPPEKGSFPLDRAGECRKAAHLFLSCIDANHHDYSACKDLSKAYLQCRMDKNLMQKEDLGKLGFKKPLDESDASSAAAPDKPKKRRDEEFYDGKRETEGFVAGTGVKPGKKNSLFG